MHVFVVDVCAFVFVIVWLCSCIQVPSALYAGVYIYVLEAGSVTFSQDSRYAFYLFIYVKLFIYFVFFVVWALLYKSC